MAVLYNGDSLAVIAATDLSDKQYHAVNFDANGKLVVAGAATSPLGILEDDPRAGEPGTVKVFGFSKWKAGAAVAKNDFLTTDDQGRAVPATSGQPIVAKALEAGNANEIIPVLILNAGAQA